jgi:hypothetical protein
MGNGIRIHSEFLDLLARVRYSADVAALLRRNSAFLVAEYLSGVVAPSETDLRRVPLARLRPVLETVRAIRVPDQVPPPNTPPSMRSL